MFQIFIKKKFQTNIGQMNQPDMAFDHQVSLQNNLFCLKDRLQSQFGKSQGPQHIEKTCELPRNRRVREAIFQIAFSFSRPDMMKQVKKITFHGTDQVLRLLFLPDLNIMVDFCLQLRQGMKKRFDPVELLFEQLADGQDDRPELLEKIPESRGAFRPGSRKWTSGEW